jgi:hypothetical protein
MSIDVSVSKNKIEKQKRTKEEYWCVVVSVDYVRPPLIPQFHPLAQALNFSKN